MNHRLPIPTSAFLLLATIALPQCNVYDTSERTDRESTIATAFDPLSGPKDTTAPEPFLDPLSLFSDQVYVIQPLAPHQEGTTSAVFAGGEEAMITYIKAAVVAHLAPGIGWLKHPAVHFTINAQGATEQVELIRSSGNEALDAVLIGTLSDMPPWTAATDAHGRPVAQPFAFTVGPGGC